MATFMAAPLLNSIKILSWNVNGLRSFLRHDTNGATLVSLLNRREVDILCLQETKLQDIHVPVVENEFRTILGDDARFFWHCSTARKGYSGTATIILNKNVEISNIIYGNGCDEGNNE
eukprot:gene46127-61676_t